MTINVGNHIMTAPTPGSYIVTLASIPTPLKQGVQSKAKIVAAKDHPAAVAARSMASKTQATERARAKK